MLDRKTDRTDPFFAALIVAAANATFVPIASGTDR